MTPEVTWMIPLGAEMSAVTTEASSQSPVSPSSIDPSARTPNDSPSREEIFRWPLFGRTLFDARSRRFEAWRVHSPWLLRPSDWATFLLHRTSGRLICSPHNAP